jgi:hypothetical protein
MKRNLLAPALCLASLVYGASALLTPIPARADAGACCADPTNPSACGSDPSWYCCTYHDYQCDGPDFRGVCARNDCPPNPM